MAKLLVCRLNSIEAKKRRGSLWHRGDNPRVLIGKGGNSQKEGAGVWVVALAEEVRSETHDVGSGHGSSTDGF